jgi:hypothetical protein
MSNKSVNRNIKKNDLEKDIKLKYSIIDRAKKQMRFAAVFILIFGLLAFWAYSGYIDPMFPSLNNVVRTIVKVISTLGLVLSIGFTVIYFIGIKRSRKFLLEEIAYFEKMD